MQLNVEELREYCLKKKGVGEDFPFNDETLVFKVMGKIFALIPLERIPLQVNLKCDPELAFELIEKYETVQPGYQMNSKTPVKNPDFMDHEAVYWTSIDSLPFKDLVK